LIRRYGNDNSAVVFQDPLPLEKRTLVIFYMFEHIKSANYIINLVLERQINIVNFRNISVAKVVRKKYSLIRCIDIVDCAEIFEHVNRAPGAAANIQYS